MGAEGWLSVPGIAISSATALAAFFRISSPTRKALRRDVDLLATLPSDFIQRDPLVDSISKRIEVEFGANPPRRDWNGVILYGLIAGVGVGVFLVAFGYAGEIPVWQTIVWAFLAIVIYVIGAFFLYESWSSVQRDRKGKKLSQG